ncbi:hypothetical protein Tco_1475319 [Tanacetum coccineum]
MRAPRIVLNGLERLGSLRLHLTWPKRTGKLNSCLVFFHGCCHIRGSCLPVKYSVLDSGKSLRDKMEKENLPASTRSDEQLVPVKARLPYGKSNLLLDLHKLQKNPIFRISITPVDPANLFVSPPAGEIVMDFVNELGYPEAIHFVSHMHVNNLYQPWRAILSLIYQCLTGKTSGNDKPRHPVLQMLWGIVTKTNVDYAELLWERNCSGIQTSFTHWDRSKYNIHMRPESPRHVTGDDFLLVNLNFVPKGEKDEVFGMPIPNQLITEAFFLAPSDRHAVRSHMRILSVVSLKTISRYGYTYLKEIVLRIAGYKEYKISESDFKNLHSNDFKDLYLLHLQGKLNHLSDLTCSTKILDKLDHMVKDFKLFKYNPGMETRIWSEDDRRRSKEFMEVIERRLKIRRIFRNLKSFIGRRLRDVDYRLIQRIE